MNPIKFNVVLRLSFWSDTPDDLLMDFLERVLKSGLRSPVETSRRYLTMVKRTRWEFSCLRHHSRYQVKGVVTWWIFDSLHPFNTLTCYGVERLGI